DLALNAALADLKHYDFGELPILLVEIDKQIGEFNKLRMRVDQADPSVATNYNDELSAQWFAVATSLIQQTQNAWLQFIKHFADIDSSTVLGMRFKHVLGIIMDYSGRQRALIGRLLAENADPTPEEQAQLLQWQGVVETGWVLGNTLIDQSRIYAAIK